MPTPSRQAPKQVTKKIAANLKRMRRESGMTQEQLAAIAGVSSVKMIEKRGSAEIGILYSITRALGRPLAAVFEGVTPYDAVDAKK